MTVFAGNYVKEMYLYEGEKFNLQGIDPSKRQKVNIIESAGLKRCLGFIAGVWLERQVANMNHGSRKIIVDVELPVRGAIRKVPFVENENHVLKPSYIMFNGPQKLTAIPADRTQKVRLCESTGSMFGKIKGMYWKFRLVKAENWGTELLLKSNYQ